MGAAGGTGVDVFHTWQRAIEPTLGVDRDGTIFYASFEANVVPRFFVLRSADGHDWTDVSPRLPDGRPAHKVSLDGVLYLDDTTGRVFLADHTPPCSQVSFTDDEGETWSTGAACGLDDHPNLFAGPPALSPTAGYPNVVYYCSIQGGLGVVMGAATGCLKSLDGGLTFVSTGSPPYADGVNPEPGNYGVPGWCGGVTGHGFVDREGTVYLPRGWCGRPWLAISDDEGATWRRVQVADNGMAFHTGGPSGLRLAGKGRYPGARGRRHSRRARDDLLLLHGDEPPSLSGRLERPRGVVEPPVDDRPAGVDRGEPPVDGHRRARQDRDGVRREHERPRRGRARRAGPDYSGATWNGYVTIVDTPLPRRPRLLTATINDPKDPLMIGECAMLRCQQQFDFIDVVLDRRARAWTSMVDGCPPPGRCIDLGHGILGRVTVPR